MEVALESTGSVAMEIFNEGNEKSVGVHEVLLVEAEFGASLGIEKEVKSFGGVAETTNDGLGLVFGLGLEFRTGLRSVAAAGFDVGEALGHDPLGEGLMMMVGATEMLSSSVLE